MVQNDKKLCPSRSVSQEPYIIWLSFMLHLCKLIISPGNFFIFSKFWFFGLLGRWKGKKWSKMTKNSIYCTPYLRNHTTYDCHLCLLNDNIFRCFFYFLKILIFWVHRWVKAKNVPEWKKNCLSCSISQEPYIKWLSFIVQMF